MRTLHFLLFAHITQHPAESAKVKWVRAMAQNFSNMIPTARRVKQEIPRTKPLHDIAIQQLESAYQALTW